MQSLPLSSTTMMADFVWLRMINSIDHVTKIIIVLNVVDVNWCCSIFNYRHDKRISGLNHIRTERFGFVIQPYWMSNPIHIAYSATSVSEIGTVQTWTPGYLSSLQHVQKCCFDFWGIWEPEHWSIEHKKTVLVLQKNHIALDFWNSLNFLKDFCHVKLTKFSRVAGRFWITCSNSNKMFSKLGMIKCQIWILSAGALFNQPCMQLILCAKNDAVRSYSKFIWIARMSRRCLMLSDGMQKDHSLLHYWRGRATQR